MRKCLMRKCLMRKCLMRKCLMRKCLMRECLMRKCLMYVPPQTYFAYVCASAMRPVTRYTSHGESLITSDLFKHKAFLNKLQVLSISKGIRLTYKKRCERQSVQASRGLDSRGLVLQSKVSGFKGFRHSFFINDDFQNFIKILMKILIT